MEIDTSKLIPKVAVSDKPVDCENLARFMLLTSLYVRQVLKDKEEYKERYKRTRESEGDS